jgi:hypothetical protein
MARVPTRTTFVAICLLALAGAAAAQEPATGPAAPAAYPILLLDSPYRYLTMREVDENYLTGYRLFASALNAHLKPAASFLIQGAACLVLLKTMTHEEGHRAVLTAEGIDAASRVFVFMPRAGFVDGVTDATLEHPARHQVPGVHSPSHRRVRIRLHADLARRKPAGL